MPECHSGFIKVTSYWPPWLLKSPASWLFTQSFVQVQIKENIKALCHWPLWGKFNGDRWIPRTKTQWRENVSIWWRYHVLQVSSSKATVERTNTTHLTTIQMLTFAKFSDSKPSENCLYFTDHALHNNCTHTSVLNRDGIRKCKVFGTTDIWKIKRIEIFR